MRKYQKIFSLAVVYSLRNYKGLVGRAIFLLACMIVFLNLWKVIGVQWNVNELLWYIALNQWILLSFPQPEVDIENDLRSGKLAYLLVRPVSYLGAVFSEALGMFLVNLIVMGVITFGFTWACVGWIPISMGLLPVVVVSTFLAGCLVIVVQMMIGVSAFWLHEVDPLTWLWEKLIFAFGGLILPLSFYPEWCQTIVKYTPFPYILGGRSAIVLGEGSKEIILGLLIWMSVAVLCLVGLYRKGMKILNVEGG